jgi:hypothetical protein
MHGASKRMRQRLLCAALSTSIAAATTTAQETPVDTIPWPPRNRLAVTATARLESVRGDTIRLTYSVQSHATSVQAGSALFFRRYTKTWLVGSPKRWVGDSTLVQDSAAVIWYSVTTADNLDPGENLTGFSIAGLGVPDLVTLRVPGDTPAPVYDDSEPDRYGERASIWVDAAEVATVGIVPQPSGAPAVLLTRLSRLSSRACELGWIAPVSTCSGLNARLSVARTELANGQSGTALSEIDAYIADLEARRGGEVSESAYALLWPNAKTVSETMNRARNAAG